MEVKSKCSDVEHANGFKVLTSDEPLPKCLQESVDRIIKKEGFLTNEVKSKAVTTAGGNFMGDLYEVNIKGKTANGDKELNIFIKSKIDDENITLIDVSGCYSQETFFYAELAGLFENLQNKRNIPENERYRIVKCFDAENPDAIILDNLAKKGFGTFDRMDVVSYEFAKLSVQQLARFHGLSWVLKKEQPEYFERKLKPMKLPYTFNERYVELLQKFTEYTVDCVDGDTGTKITQYVQPAIKRMNSYLFENENVRCCLCHGDYRANNILMKKVDGKVAEVIPIDFQFLYYGCPVMDFIFFIFPCTDQEFRKRHLDDLKDEYYSSLKKFLKYFDVDVETVYPRKEFESVYRERLDYGLTVSLILTPILFTDENDIPSWSKDDMANVSVSPLPKMEDRVKDIVGDFQQLGVL